MGWDPHGGCDCETSPSIIGVWRPYKFFYLQSFLTLLHNCCFTVVKTVSLVHNLHKLQRQESSYVLCVKNQIKKIVLQNNLVDY